jgi:hypothetical protein
MQFDLSECMAKHELKCFGHVTMIGKRRSHEITKVSTPKWTEKDLMQHDGADYSVILITANKKTNGSTLSDAGQKCKKLLIRFRRRRKPTMK